MVNRARQGSSTFGMRLRTNGWPLPEKVVQRNWCHHLVEERGTFLLYFFLRQVWKYIALPTHAKVGLWKLKASIHPAEAVYLLSLPQLSDFLDPIFDIPEIVRYATAGTRSSHHSNHRITCQQIIIIFINTAAMYSASKQTYRTGRISNARCNHRYQPTIRFFNRWSTLYRSTQLQ